MAISVMGVGDRVVLVSPLYGYTCTPSWYDGAGNEVNFYRR